MATFVINEGWDSPKTVEADSYDEQGSFVHFYDDGGHVFSMPTKNVYEIKRQK